jgi:long-chain acyl-CoA synthetase
MLAGVMLQVMGAIAQSSPVARKLFHLAFESKRAALKQGDLSGGRFGALWDRLVFSKVRARLGGGFAGWMPSSACIIPYAFLCMQHCLLALVAFGI